MDTHGKFFDEKGAEIKTPEGAVTISETEGKKGINIKYYADKN